MEAIFRDELTESGALPRQRAEELTESLGLDLQFGYAGALARNAKEFNVHGLVDRACHAKAPRATAGNLMITWAFNPRRPGPTVWSRPELANVLMTVEIPSKGKRSRVRGTPKGRAVDPKAREEVRSLLGDAPRRRDLLIEHLHKIQDRFGCLSAAHLVALAAEMKMAMAEVYEVATFYHHFDVVKEGETAPAAITVRVCDSIACELAGSHDLLKKLPALLGQDVRVLHAPCVGRCETAPVAVVGQNPVPHATAEKVVSLVNAKSVTHSTTDVTITPGHIDYAAYRAAGGYALAASCVSGSRTPADVIAVMENSGLRGLGGAGFPAGRKWKIVAAEPAPRLMAINIDEGEPGTFKDRYYLERDPHRFLEGAIVAAWAVEIDAVYIYLRDEYHGCRAILEREIAALQADPPCKLPEFHLRRGAGA